MHRFHAPDATRGAEVPLPGEEADHARRVLRLRSGDGVRVFDGRGNEFAGEVIAIDRSDVRVRVGDAVEPARELRTKVTLVQAALKGDKMDAVVRDSVMLGVSIVQPLLTTRTEMSKAAAFARVERWRRIAIASTKQCGRAWLAEIDGPCSMDEWMLRRKDSFALMLVEPSAGVPIVRHLRELTDPVPPAASILVGPEGGWTGDEVRAAGAAGVTLVTLGPRTLRADAVALVALSVVAAAWD